MKDYADPGRTEEHEHALYSPHVVNPNELNDADEALKSWTAAEANLPIDTSEWRVACYMAQIVAGWIQVATEYGQTRRSLSRTIVRATTIAKDSP